MGSSTAKFLYRECASAQFPRHRASLDYDDALACGRVSLVLPHEAHDRTRGSLTTSARLEAGMRARCAPGGRAGGRRCCVRRCCPRPRWARSARRSAAWRHSGARRAVRDREHRPRGGAGGGRSDSEEPTFMKHSADRALENSFRGQTKVMAFCRPLAGL